MIMKLDHIGIVYPRTERETVQNSHDILFEEISLRNIDAKKELLSTVQEDHDILFSPEEPFAKEYLFYDHVEQQTPNRYENGILYGYYRDAESTKTALSGSAFIKDVEEKDGILQGVIGGVLDRKKLPFVLEPADRPMIFLDSAGINNVALLCSNPYMDETGKFVQTPYQELSVNGKILNISFLSMDSLSIIFEFVCPKGNKE
ncbi:MAG: hypothetical protein IJU25_05040 [Lachnospiraceae bacterium]|nr:hypothetical protein [Lachnospiraceae bacterium]